MKQLKICTYNVRNDNLIEGFTNQKIQDCYHQLLRDYQIDVLTTQEMIESTLSILTKELRNYHIIGGYRYGKSKFVKKVKILHEFNEANNIITKLPVLTELTTDLPWFPRSFKELISGIFKYRSITPRIITEAILDIENYGRVRFLNTHLDCHLRGVKTMQLNRLKKKIRSSTIPIVLTGDFNADIDDRLFSKFVSELKELGLKRIEFDQRTFKKTKRPKAIDHIFIPYHWEVRSIEIIDEQYLNGYSDHYPVITSVIPKN